MQHIAFLMSVAAVVATDPFWGCGLLGGIPGIKNGQAVQETQRLIDGLKKTSSSGKVSYWNWNYAPMTDLSPGGAGKQALTSEFEFMPENWGMGAAENKDVRGALSTNFLDEDGDVCPAMMADIFLGGNEPDITGSCMGGMMGDCTASCTNAEAQAGNCPVCHLDAAEGSEHANENHHCDCWSAAHATGVGFWPLEGCSGNQPLPDLFDDAQCVSVVKSNNAKTGAIIAAKGYRYFSTPLVAANMDYLKSFVKMACSDCQSIECGCPTHIAWHFYANDCRPEETGGYKNFQAKLDATIEIMEEFPQIKGALVNEVGMLNCDMSTPDASCIPNGPTQKYPAKDQLGHTCPSTNELPNGMASFLETLLSMVAKAKTKDGRPAVAGMSWFNLEAGGTYNLRLFDDSGNLNALGEAYISACQEWASGTPIPSHKPLLV